MLNEKIYEATYDWVNEFNAIPTEMIGKLMKLDSDDCWKEITVTEPENCEEKYTEKLPTWSTMWSFNSMFDVFWLENYNGIQKMSECGFRIYKSDKYGYFFGIDGADSIIHEHFVPLYEARGLRWHCDEEDCCDEED